MSIITNPPGLMQDGSSWERAMAANAARRTAEAQQQIEDARAEPTVAEREAERDDAQLNANVAPLPDTLTLSGAKLAAYRQLESAATAAHEAQQAMATTGVALRDAIQAMCAAMTSGAK